MENTKEKNKKSKNNIQKTTDFSKYTSKELEIYICEKLCEKLFKKRES